MTTQQHPVQAISLMMGAVFALSVMDVNLKLLVDHYPSLQVVFLRGLISIPAFAIWMVLRDRSQFRTAYPLGHLVRGIFGLAMLWTVGECFREMHLADAYAIFFAAPLLISLLSGPILGEPAGLVRIVAALIGFVGVLVVLKPGGGEWIGYGAIMGLLGVCCYAVVALLLRSMGQRDNTVTIAFYFSLLVSGGAGLLSIADWQAIDPAHWGLIALLGISGTIGQVMITAAFRRASVAIVAPFDYVHMVWAVIFGYFVWGYIPGTATWIGSTIVVLSGLFILFRERRLANFRF